MEALLTIFSALADETRLRIMLLVVHMELSVGEVAQILRQSQPRISRHIRILAEAGLVERRKEGSWVFLKPGSVAVMPELLALLDRMAAPAAPVAVRDREKLVEVRAERARLAETWFEEHAGEWDCLRSLHIPDEKVEAAIRALLAQERPRRLVDVGTGTGRMVELLGAQAQNVVAIDNSPSMLRLARSKIDRATDGQDGRPGVEFLRGDFNQLPLADADADLAIYHQVLHYAQHPRQVLAEAARILAPGGKLLVVDFDRHEREELRHNFAHARLGFSDEDMARWYEAAGLALDRVERVDGGALTVKLWLGTRLGRAVRPDIKSA